AGGPAAGTSPEKGAPAAKGEAKGLKPVLDDGRDVWTLGFQWKDPRFLAVDVPGQGRKPVMYLYYDLSNTTGQPRTAIPHFELVVAGDSTVHHDRVFPRAHAAIRQLEDPTDQVKLKDSVTIAARPIPPTRPGALRRPMAAVAIWEGVSPRATRFTIFALGLSNAWSLTEATPPAREPVVRRKALQLDFKRVDDRVVFVPPARWVYRTT